jgi:hypothetical protein
MRKSYSSTEMQIETEHQTETGRRKPYTKGSEHKSEAGTRKPDTQFEQQTETAGTHTEPGKREPYTTSINQNGMPSIEDFLQGGRDLNSRIALAFGLPGPSHEAARLHDHLRLLEDVIYEQLLSTVGGWHRVRDNLKEKVRKFGELALEPIALLDLWRAEVRFEYNRKFELINRRWEEQLEHGETRDDWDPLKILGVLPFEQWVKQLLDGEDAFRSSVVSSERSASLDTRKIAHRIANGETASG